MQKSSRRTFLKGTAITCLASSLGASFASKLLPEAHAKAPLAQVPTEYFYSGCANNCGSSCILKCYTKDGEVIRIETDNTIKDEWDKGLMQVRACPRGRSLRRYNDDSARLKYPMKRVGKRGEGKFERITWEEAYDTIADKLKYCKENFGNESILRQYATGASYSALAGNAILLRMMNFYGGIAIGYNSYSTAQINTGMTYIYGSSARWSNPISDIQYSKLVVFFGDNPTETRMSGGGIQYELLEAKKKSGAKIIVIDPRYSETCVTVADEWIPIRPGTDAALVAALSYTLIKEDMIDKQFVARCVQGFDNSQMPKNAPANSSYSDYILGTGYDMVAKTPAWASAITGIPEERIIQLAREIGQAKPCYIAQGWGPQRHASGELVAISIATLAAITGNIGMRGGNTGERDKNFPIGYPTIPSPPNPVKAKFPVFMWPEAIERGHTLTAEKDGVTGADVYPSDIKFIWNFAGNCMINQHSDVNLTRKMLEDDTKCEMIVVLDTHHTASVDVADIVLPCPTYYEVNDIYGPSYGQNADYLVFSRAIKPKYEECKDMYEICTEISRRLGIEEQFTEGKTREEWIEELFQGASKKKIPSLPATLEEARKQGVWHQEKPRADLPCLTEAFAKDPIKNPIPTPSGKIEVYSTKLAELAKTRANGDALGEEIHPIGLHLATWDSYEDYETKKKYPLQMIGHHYKGRTHSMYANCDWLLEIMPQMLWMHPIDAAARGIKHEDKAIVTNDRGEVEISVKVTDRIMPGVISMPQGAWYRANNKGTDVGGCVNTLTWYRPTIIGKANPQHTNLVEVRKA